MIDKSAILKRVTKIEDKLLISKLLDKAEKAEYINNSVFSHFLDPYQRSVIEKALAGTKNLNYAFSGGYNGAERVIIIFGPNFIFQDDDIIDELPLKVIRVEVLSRESLTHRDYLGAFMSLGIKREKIGDILVGEETCDIIVLSDIAEYIAFNLDRIGKAKIMISVKEVDSINTPDSKTKEIKASVASLRLDCVASAGFGISRSKILELIKADRVNLNWDTANTPTKQVKEGDTISIRGKGRLVMESVGSITRKDRIRILLKKYI
ncbi:MAG: YlmH/Sll1252 family protein [Clostridia bacterium]|nr:YlmH/Sll1252 family protein [Clostridia bacterium]